MSIVINGTILKNNLPIWSHCLQTHPLEIHDIKVVVHSMRFPKRERDLIKFAFLVLQNCPRLSQIPLSAFVLFGLVSFKLLASLECSGYSRCQLHFIKQVFPVGICKGKNHCTTADLLFYLLTFSCFANVESATYLIMWSKPNQSNQRQALWPNATLAK